MELQPGAPSDQPDQMRHHAIEDLIDALRLFTVESDVFVDVFAQAHALGRSDLNAIMWISEGNGSGSPITAGELAGKLGLGAPATSALIDRLEHAGHVRRVRDAKDRRKVTLAMEQPALSLAIAFFEPLGVQMSSAVDGVSTEQLDVTAQVVRQLTDAITAARQAAQQ